MKVRKKLLIPGTAAVDHYRITALRILFSLFFPSHSLSSCFSSQTRDSPSCVAFLSYREKIPALLFPADSNRIVPIPMINDNSKSLRFHFFIYFCESSTQVGFELINSLYGAFEDTTSPQRRPAIDYPGRNISKYLYGVNIHNPDTGTWYHTDTTHHPSTTSYTADFYLNFYIRN